MKSMLNNPFDHGYFESNELRNFGFKAVGENVRIAKSATIIGLNNVSLGNNIRIDGNTVITASSGSLALGDYIHIGCNVYLGCIGGITLSDFSGISHGVCIYSGSDDYSGKMLTNPLIPKEFLNVYIAPVHFGKHVIIGSGSVVLPGVNIGIGAAVGALSLVTKSLDEWGIYFGSPAKKINRRKKDLLIHEADLMAKKNK